MEFPLSLILVCATAAVMADIVCRVCVSLSRRPSWWIVSGAALGASLVISTAMFYHSSDGFLTHRFWSESAVPLFIAIGVGFVICLAPAALVVSQYRKNMRR